MEESTFRLVCDFGGAVINQWSTLATGGVVMGFIALLEKYRGKPINRKVMLFVFVVFLLVAFFKTWESEYIKRVASENAYNEKWLSLKTTALRLSGEISEFSKNWKAQMFSGKSQQLSSTFNARFRLRIIEVWHELDKQGLSSQKLDWLCTSNPAPYEFSNFDLDTDNQIAEEIKTLAAKLK